MILAGTPAVGLERAAYYALLAFVALLPFSIVASQVLLTITGLLWVGVVVRGRERIEAPRMFWPLAAYAAATLGTPRRPAQPCRQPR